MTKKQKPQSKLKRNSLIVLGCILTLLSMHCFVRVAYADPGMEKIDLTKVDPLQIGGSDNAIIKMDRSNAATDLSTPGGILSRSLTYAFPIAGTILFVMILWGGFEMISGATESKSLEAGKQRITAAAVGFLLLFASYWITQLLQIVFNISILG